MKEPCPLHCSCSTHLPSSFQHTLLLSPTKRKAFKTSQTQQSNMHMHYSAAVWNWTGSKADLLDQLFYIWFQLFCYARRWRSQNNLVLGLQITPRWLTTKPSSSPAPAYLWTTKEHRSLLSANDRCKWVLGMGKKKRKRGSPRFWGGWEVAGDITFHYLLFLFFIRLHRPNTLGY